MKIIKSSIYIFCCLMFRFVMSLGLFYCSCHGCVSSNWGCNWCVREHVCTHKTQCEQEVIIYNENVSLSVPNWPFCYMWCVCVRVHVCAR